MLQIVVMTGKQYPNFTFISHFSYFLSLPHGYALFRIAFLLIYLYFLLRSGNILLLNIPACNTLWKTVTTNPKAGYSSIPTYYQKTVRLRWSRGLLQRMARLWPINWRKRAPIGLLFEWVCNLYNSVNWMVSMTASRMTVEIRYLFEMTPGWENEKRISK